MKKIALLAIGVGLSVSLNSCGRETGTKTEKNVSAATISQLPPDKTFEIDLTHKGTVYKFDDADTDFSRVTIHTAAGVKNFADLLKRTDTSFKGGLVLGTPDDMRDHLPTSTGGTTKYDCGGLLCSCHGSFDCLSMISSGTCRGEFWCDKVGDACYCGVGPS